MEYNKCGKDYMDNGIKCEDCPRYMDDCDGRSDMWDNLSKEEQAEAIAEDIRLSSAIEKMYYKGKTELI